MYILFLFRPSSAASRALPSLNIAVYNDTPPSGEPCSAFISFIASSQCPNLVYEPVASHRDLINIRHYMYIYICMTSRYAFSFVFLLENPIWIQSGFHSHTETFKCQKQQQNTYKMSKIATKWVAWWKDVITLRTLCCFFGVGGLGLGPARAGPDICIYIYIYSSL